MFLPSKYIVVAYDIENDRTRLQIADILQYYGLMRIQYSVFAGEIPSNKINELSSLLFDSNLAETDNITVFPLCRECQDKVLTLEPLPQEIKHLSL